MYEGVSKVPVIFYQKFELSQYQSYLFSPKIVLLG
ncbi:hypothetical protein EZS27_031124, partial [termite gut metagenome]